MPLLGCCWGRGEKRPVNESDQRCRAGQEGPQPHPATNQCFSVSAEFSIWTREAGAGGLSIAVEGPSKAEITFDDHKNGSCGVSYIAQEPGMYSGAKSRLFFDGGGSGVRSRNPWSELE